MTTVDLKYSPRPWQAKCHADRSRFRVIALHRRGGKTVYATMELINAALKFEKELGLFVFIAPFLSQAKAIAWGMIKFRLKQLIEMNAVHINEAELTITFLHNGAKLRLFGADNPDNMRGIRLDGCVLDDVAQMRPEVFDDIVQPALSDRKGWAIFIGTPAGVNMFSEKFFKAKTLPDWNSHLFTVYDTDAIEPEEVTRLKRDMAQSSFEREYLCCAPGSKIFTSCGQKNIEDIKTGDLVLSHAGRFRSVLKTFENQYDGELIEITTYGDAVPLRVTPNHPIRISNRKTNSTFWKPAGEITIDDILVRPTRAYHKTKIIDADIVELMGWYIAEGSLAKTAVNIALGASEKMEIQRLHNCLDRLKLKYSCRVERSVSQTTIKNTTIADMLSATCGKMAYAKRIPWDLISGHEQLLFDILMLGDGCSFELKGQKYKSYSTVSETLAYDMQLLAGTLGHSAAITRGAAKKSVICGRVVNCREKFEVRMPIYDKKYKKYNGKNKSFPVNHGIGVKVKSVNKANYSGPVYNFEVQFDHSYIVNGRSVHNCNFDAGGNDQLISLGDVDAAAQKKYKDGENNYAPRILASDPARYGDDSSVIQKRQGFLAWEPIVFKGMDNMALADQIAYHINDWKPDAVFVDAGNGSGVIDRLRQLGHTVIEVPFNGKSADPKCANKRAEMYCNLRDWLKDGGSIPDNQRLKQDLATPRYWFDKNNKLILEPKDDIKSRGLPSPDYSDALALTFAAPVVKKNREDFFGRKSAHSIEYNPLDSNSARGLT